MSVNRIILCAFIVVLGHRTSSQSTSTPSASTSPSTSTTPSASTSPSTSTTPSAGTVVADTLNKDLSLAEQYLYDGISKVGDPAFKFGIDTAPHLAHLYAIANGVDIPPALAALGKDVYGRIAAGGGKLLGSGIALGGSVLGNGLEIGGSVLEANNKVLEAGAKAGINLAGKVGDHLAGAAGVSGTIAQSGLTALGDGLQVAGVGVDTISKGISRVLDAVAARLIIALGSAKAKLAAIMDSNTVKLENGLLTFTSKAQEKTYNLLTGYVTLLSHVQNILDQLTLSISGVVKPSLTSTSSTSTSTTSSATAKSTSASDSASKPVKPSLFKWFG